MARVPRGSWVARRRALDRLRRGSAHSAASRNHPQGCTWTGVQERVRGRWAARIRVPGTHTRLWIGRFEQALEAALAYDTALFCFHGPHRLPSPRRFNFPAAPRPKIREDVRATLTRADIKRIAESHARFLANFYVGTLPGVSPAAASPPPPPPPAAAAGADGAAAVANEATATTDGSNGNNCMG
ncbi:ethylene-responsive transcription factor ERF015-like [Miscanthus floridulus]|uniref:ethylene-responsive transcription factor ERF015-like n=1 Tax=Miscanthus floridulus TaxID=154761 RepID=UPI0034588971